MGSDALMLFIWFCFYFLRSIFIHCGVGEIFHSMFVLKFIGLIPITLEALVAATFFQVHGFVLINSG